MAQKLRIPLMPFVHEETLPSPHITWTLATYTTLFIGSAVTNRTVKVQYIIKKVSFHLFDIHILCIFTPENAYFPLASRYTRPNCPKGIQPKILKSRHILKTVRQEQKLITVHRRTCCHEFMRHRKCIGFGRLAEV